MVNPGTQVCITPRDGSKPILGVVVSEPTKGKMAILLNDGRGYLGYVSTHSPGKYRVLIEDHILVLPAEAVTLIRPLSPLSMAKATPTPTQKTAPVTPKRTRKRSTLNA